MFGEEFYFSWSWAICAFCFCWTTVTIKSILGYDQSFCDIDLFFKVIGGHLEYLFSDHDSWTIPYTCIALKIYRLVYLNKIMWSFINDLDLHFSFMCGHLRFSFLFMNPWPFKMSLLKLIGLYTSANVGENHSFIMIDMTSYVILSNMLRCRTRLSMLNVKQHHNLQS